jgi:hypothetical protein
MFAEFQRNSITNSTMPSCTTCCLCGFILSSLLILIPIPIFLFKASADPAFQDVLEIIQIVTGIFGVLGFILTTGVFFYDRNNKRKTAQGIPIDDIESGQSLLSNKYPYQGGLVECAKAHIKRLCEEQLIRYRAFSANNKRETRLFNASSDLVQLEYDEKKEMWAAPSGGKHFDSEHIMRMITENKGRLNLLIEVFDDE